MVSEKTQGSKIALVRSYLRVPQGAGRVKILIFLVKIIFSPYMPIVFVMQGKCLFSDISRPETMFIIILMGLKYEPPWLKGQFSPMEFVYSHYQIKFNISRGNNDLGLQQYQKINFSKTFLLNCIRKQT